MKIDRAKRIIPPFLRYMLWARDAKRDAQVAQRFCNANGRQLIDIYRSPVLDSSVCKTVFILGSGSSVNELTDEMLLHIGKHQSIGINFWFFHDFVPTAYSFDSGRLAPDEEGRIRELVVRLGGLFGRPQVRDRRPNIIYLRPYQSDPGYLIPTPPELQGLSWVSARANLVSRDPFSLETDLLLLVKRVISGKLPRAALPDNGSSVVRLIFLALAQGFTEIVLVGVDLDARPHFWFATDYTRRYPQYVELFPKPDREPHGTTEANNRPIGNLDFLPLLGKVLARLNIAELSVASPTSQLAQVLPTYSWPHGIDKS